MGICPPRAPQMSWEIALDLLDILGETYKLWVDNKKIIWF
jgi:hypothetical protein